jgi:hypothetical protein
MAESHIECENCVVCGNGISSKIVVTEKFKAGDIVNPTPEYCKLFDRLCDKFSNAIVAIDPIIDILDLHLADGSHTRINAYWVEKSGAENE